MNTPSKSFIKYFVIFLMCYFLSCSGLKHMKTSGYNEIKEYVFREFKTNKVYNKYSKKINVSLKNEVYEVCLPYDIYKVWSYENKKEYITFYVVVIDKDTIVNLYKFDNETLDSNKLEVTMNKLQSNYKINNDTTNIAGFKIGEGVYNRFNHIRTHCPKR